MIERKIFGTDGIRGTANLYPMTSEVALNLGRAVAYRARRRSIRPKIIVGKDTRLSCYMLEMALISGICSMGADVLMAGPIPTPGIAYLTVDMRCDAGIMITASHNPFEDNGIKIFGPDGFKLSDEEELEIEGYIFNHSATDQFISPDDDSYPKKELVGKVFKIEDSRGRYIAHLKSIFPKNMDLTGMKIVVDCANGAGYKVAPAVFEELGAEVTVIGNHPNGTNINDSGAINTSELENILSANKGYYDLGIALDGDADRLVVVDEIGKAVDGDVLLAALLEDSCLKEMVTTVMSNAALDEYASSLGCTSHRTDVGDRHVIDKMRKDNIKFGGENSGHIIFLDHSTTGDGIAAALKLLEMMKSRSRKASELAGEFEMYSQTLINLVVPYKDVPVDDIGSLKNAINGATAAVGKEGRVLVRYSGTESKLRIMVEHKDEAVAKMLAEGIADVARTAFQIE